MEKDEVKAMLNKVSNKVSSEFSVVELRHDADKVKAVCNKFISEMGILIDAEYEKKGDK